MGDGVNDDPPDANRGQENQSTQPAAGESSERDRGNLSRRKLEQFEQAKKTGLETGGESEDAEQHQEQDDGERDTEKPGNKRHLKSPWVVD